MGIELQVVPSGPFAGKSFDYYDVLILRKEQLLILYQQKSNLFSLTQEAKSLKIIPEICGKTSLRTDATCGRYVVADADISPGEVVAADAPALR